MGLIDLFKKKDADNSLAAKKNWYADRYQTVLVQRNFLVLLTIASLVGIVVSVLAVIKVTSSKTIEPFVIEIEEKSGITNVIRPLLTQEFTGNEALRRYFIMKYLNARETYDGGSYQYNYFTVVRLLSAGDVYSEFRRFATSDTPGSPVRLGPRGSKTIKVKSISPTPAGTQGQTGFTYQVRFTQISQEGQKNLIAIINFDFIDLNLTTEERDINPLGFEVLGYRVDEETL